MLLRSSSVFAAPLVVVLTVVFAVCPIPVAASTWNGYELDVDGTQREYFVFVPDGAPNQLRPTVVALHGFESDANGLRWLTRSDSAAERFGVTMVYPNAENRSWNAGKGFGSENKTSDDLGFMRVLIQDLPSRHGADPKRIYVMGFSNGAQLAGLVACRMSESIAAAAMVAQTLNVDDCQPDSLMPMALIHGAKDTLAPFGGGGPFELRSHADSVKLFQELNQVRGEGESVVDRESVRCLSFGRDSGGEVLDCVASANGHTWPGGVEFKVELFGSVNKEIHATEVLFDFFSRHQRAVETPVPQAAPEELNEETVLPQRGFVPPPGSLASLDRQERCDFQDRDHAR